MIWFMNYLWFTSYFGTLVFLAALDSSDLTNFVIFSFSAPGSKKI